MDPTSANLKNKIQIFKNIRSKIQEKPSLLKIQDDQLPYQLSLSAFIKKKSLSHLKNNNNNNPLNQSLKVKQLEIPDDSLNQKKVQKIKTPKKYKNKKILNSEEQQKINNYHNDNDDSKLLQLSQSHLINYKFNSPLKIKTIINQNDSSLLYDIINTKNLTQKFQRTSKSIKTSQQNSNANNSNSSPDSTKLNDYLIINNNTISFKKKTQIKAITNRLKNQKDDEFSKNQQLDNFFDQKNMNQQQNNSETFNLPSITFRNSCSLRPLLHNPDQLINYHQTIDSPRHNCYYDQTNSKLKSPQTVKIVMYDQKKLVKHDNQTSSLNNIRISTELLKHSSNIIANSLLHNSFTNFSEPQISIHPQIIYKKQHNYEKMFNTTEQTDQNISMENIKKVKSTNINKSNSNNHILPSENFTIQDNNKQDVASYTKTKIINKIIKNKINTIELEEEQDFKKLYLYYNKKYFFKEDKDELYMQQLSHNENQNQVIYNGQQNCSPKNNNKNILSLLKKKPQTEQQIQLQNQHLLGPWEDFGYSEPQEIDQIYTFQTQQKKK